MVWIKSRGQEGRIQVPLHRAYATGAVMPPLGERLSGVSSTAMTELAEFGSLGGDFDQDAARTCNEASQLCYKHPWCTQPHAPSVAFLPAFVGKLLGDNGGAHSHNFMSFAPMQAFAMRGQFALFFRLAPARSLVHRPVNNMLPSFR